MAIGISVATVAAIGVTSTLVANAATTGPYQMVVEEGADYSARANANCNAGSEFLKEVLSVEPAGPGEVTLTFTCQQP